MLCRKHDILFLPEAQLFVWLVVCLSPTVVLEDDYQYKQTHSPVFIILAMSVEHALFLTMFFERQKACLSAMDKSD